MSSLVCSLRRWLARLRSSRNSLAASRRLSAAVCFGVFAFGGFVTSTVPGIVPRSPGVVVVGVVDGGVVVGVVAGAVSGEAELSAAAAGPAIAAATASAAADTVAAFVERPTTSSYTAMGAGKHAVGVNILF